MHFFVQFVQDRVPPQWKKNSSGWITGNCPVCVEMGQPRADQKGRGGFQLHEDSWGYNCFNCRISTRWNRGKHLSQNQYKILHGLGCTDHEIQKIRIDLMRENNTTSNIKTKNNHKDIFKPAWPEKQLPKNSKYLHEIRPDNICRFLETGINMLDQRRILHLADWAYSTDLQYRRRMILPYWNNGILVGHTARYIGDPPDKTPKYLGHRPRGYLYNLDKQTPDRKFIIVTEGDFDALILGGVSLGTNSISDEQACLLRQTRKKIILLPDADRAGDELVEPARQWGWNISSPDWMRKHKDANSAALEYGRSFILRSVIESVSKKGLFGNVIARKLQRMNNG